MIEPDSLTYPAQTAALPDSEKANLSGESRRYIALKHVLEVEFPATAIQAAFDGALKKADELGAEVLEANINGATQYVTPTASISLRLPPGAVEKFLVGIEAGGKVLRHQREALDKTGAVIDADARIANLTELRNRLRRMLAVRTAQIKDVIEIEKQLADTQASLDAISSTRKVLAKQTDMVEVDIVFRSASSIPARSFSAPLVTAWNQAGDVLMSSAGGLVTFIAALLPWLVILVPTFWLTGKAWRGWRGRRSRRGTNSVQISGTDRP
ncbi:MAG TPA: DUF4349 domain-containing protein, partial [Burkholderiaceae bacterium]|jgi:hypothetical protein